ncbi:unnamed protein product [Caenorhabditis bovis]|uniref:Uncharacterized protein n=1 Tax=Caenorhabditis bovis TaxID=2654633 RepID=A0A8S1E843_9PELO|nr:unnamed protein product [Caenorhabditis bovis]
MFSCHFGYCCCCCCSSSPQSPIDRGDLRRPFKQFFESINPKSDFKNDEALETYLYQKSIEVQPKNCDPPVNDVKPRHSPTTLRSPGIKAPKPQSQSNNYSINHPVSMITHRNHSNTVPNTPVAPHETKRSFSHNSEADHHYNERRGHHNYHAHQQQQQQQQQKIPVLQPPPGYRSARRPPPPPIQPPTQNAPMAPQVRSSPTGSTTTPATGVAPPKLHPRRVAMSPLTKSPLTPSNDNHHQSTSAFQFPNVYDMAPPLPPRPSTESTSPPSTSTSAKENHDQLPIIFDREESHSPTVRLSVALPPALPPPRGSAFSRPPPPIPPKSTRAHSSSPTNSASPRDLLLEPASTPPPPLPPKTYKTRKN